MRFFSFAKVVPASTSALRQLSGSHSVQPFFIKTLSNGEKVGVCGITIQGKTINDSAPDPGTTFLDERQTATSCVAQLQNQGVNKIIMLTHIGYNYDIEWMTKIPGVDVVVGGHSHSLLANDLYATEFGLPVVAPYAAMTNGVCVVQAWSYLQAVSRLDLEFDENGGLTSCNGTAQLPLDPDNYVVISGVNNDDASHMFSTNASFATVLTDYFANLEGTPFVPAEEDAAVAAVLAPYRAQLGASKQNVIATATQTLCGAYKHNGVFQSFSACADRPLSSNLLGGVGNFIAQGLLHKLPPANIAIWNIGDVRANIAQGDFTYADVYTVHPFVDYLVLIQFTGDDIRLILENAIDIVINPTSADVQSLLAYASVLMTPKHSTTASQTPRPVGSA